MAFTQLTANVANVAALDDQPTTSAAATKAVFDKAGTDIKTFINDSLIAELEATAGAAKIGCTGATATLQAFIDAVEAAGSGTTPGAGVVTDAMMATDVKIGSLAALTTTAKTSIQAAINELVTSVATAAARIPSGLISMWHGTIANIPSGWVLCDGTNSTPDLRSKFVMGAADQAGMNATGGSNTTTLTTTQLPAHTHTGTTASDGDHAHTAQGADGGYQKSTAVSGDPSVLIEGTQTTSTTGAHTHTITTDSSGTGAAYDSRPAYYALAYIMKS
jgi:microcystin-dependent protein